MALCAHMLSRERPYACLRAPICALTSVHMPAHELSYSLPEKEAVDGWRLIFSGGRCGNTVSVFDHDV